MSWDHVENPDAYEAAIARRIKANANIGRGRRFAAAIANDSPEFQAWILGTNTPEIDLLRVAAQDAFDRTGDNGSPEDKAYLAAFDAFRAKYGKVPTFLYDAIRDWSGLTENQLAFARKAFAENIERSAGRDAAEATRKASAAPWTAGRQEVTGVVKSARWETFAVNRWASTDSLKGLILLADGRKLWTTIPKRVQPEQDSATTIVGQEITFKVTIEVSKDDSTMAFGKRPS